MTQTTEDREATLEDVMRLHDMMIRNKDKILACFDGENHRGMVSGLYDIAETYRLEIDRYQKGLNEILEYQKRLKK